MGTSDTLTSGRDAIERQGEQIADTYEDPKSLEGIVDYALDNPEQANFVPSDEYLLAAIESAGYRTVVEEGEELERPKFFDDPYNDGEHAVLGNTKLLIDFVEDLADSIEDRGNSDNMYWWIGPTASGKSEFKRCIVNGMREFSKTDEGKRYTIEWNTENLDQGFLNIDNNTLEKMYGNWDQDRDVQVEDGWEQSPDRTDPLKVFPDETPQGADRSVRQMIYDSINEGRRQRAEERIREEYGDEIEDLTEEELEDLIEQNYRRIKDRKGLDPHSQATYNELFEQYRNELGYGNEEDISVEERQEIFEKIVDETNLQVKDFVVDVGSGIGVLNSEDNQGHSDIKRELVGRWSKAMLQKYNSSGQQDVRGFSLDGLLADGNNFLTFIEDAYEHKELVKKMHSIPDEKKIGIPGGPDLELDTQIFVISNRDLEEHLRMEDGQYQETDPNESILRRMDKYPLNYLTEYGLSTQLIKSELTGENIDLLEDHEEREDKVTEGVFDDGKEYAPHALETAAIYTVLSRMDRDSESLPGKSDRWDKKSQDFPEGPDGEELTLREKVELFEKGEIVREGTRLQKDDFEFPKGREGSDGIPVTYTSEVLSGLSKKDSRRSDPEGYDLGLADVITPVEVLDALLDDLDDAAVFDDEDIQEYRDEEIVEAVEDHIYAATKEDMLDAVLSDMMPPDKEVEKYISNVLKDQDIELDPATNPELLDDETDRNLFLKTFETKYLGFDDQKHYKQNEPKAAEVKEFRDIKQAYNNAANRKRDTDEDVEWIDIDVLRRRLDELDFDHIENFNEFEDFKPHKWRESTLYFDVDDVDDAETDTTAVRAKALQNMVEENSYTRASAFLATNWLMEEADRRGDI